MLKVFKEEMKRAFCGDGMKLSLAVGMLISLAHVVQYGLVNYSMLQSTDFSRYSMVHPMPVVEGWLGGNTYNLQSFIFFLLLPLLATLPFGISYFDEQRNGVLRNVFLRVSRKEYLRAKYFSTFLSGGTAIVLPLLANLVLTMVLLPNHSGTNILTGSGINAAKIGYELYFNYPMLYLGGYFVLDFLLGGAFACVALAGSYIAAHRVVNAVLPFFLQLAVYVICSLTGEDGYTSVYFAQAGYGLDSLWVPLAYFVILIGVSFFTFWKVGIRQDVY